MHELGGNRGEMFHAHQKDKCPSGCGKSRPVQRGRSLCGIFMPGDDRHGGRQGPVGNGYPGIGRDRNRSADTGDYLKGDSRSRKGFGLFSAATEYERISAFQAHHHVPCLCTLDQQLIDGRLLRIFPRSTSSDIQALRLLGSMSEQCGIGEIVIEDHVGLCKAVTATKRQEAGIAGAGSDKIDLPFALTLSAHTDP